MNANEASQLKVGDKITNAHEVCEVISPAFPSYVMLQHRNGMKTVPHITRLESWTKVNENPH